MFVLLFKLLVQEMVVEEEGEEVEVKEVCNLGGRSFARPPHYCRIRRP